MYDRQGIVKLEMGVKPRLLTFPPCIRIFKKHVVTELGVFFEQIGYNVLFKNAHLKATDD